jgi:hypothetical protein
MDVLQKLFDVARCMCTIEPTGFRQIDRYRAAPFAVWRQDLSEMRRPLAVYPEIKRICEPKGFSDVETDILAAPIIGDALLDQISCESKVGHDARMVEEVCKPFFVMKIETSIEFEGSFQPGGRERDISARG